MNQQLWKKCAEFHGHVCPGLAIGYRATEIAMEKLGGNITRAADEEMVCITENDACGADAVQIITGCTFGKGNLIYRPTGKMAFTFFLRQSGKGVRVVLKPTPEGMSREERQRYILEAPAADVFFVKEPNCELPEIARLFSSIVCEECGEAAPEHKMRLQNGRKVCLDCFKDYSRGW
jgi:Formylmethanofuran dehydrogenase subunit E